MRESLRNLKTHEKHANTAEMKSIKHVVGKHKTVCTSLFFQHRVVMKR